MGEIMSYEQERAKQEHIKREAIKNGAHYCSDCKHTKLHKNSGVNVCVLEDSPYIERMMLGNKLYLSDVLMLEIENRITKESPCEFGENK
jgi:hypothetical protein